MRTVWDRARRAAVALSCLAYPMPGRGVQSDAPDWEMDLAKAVCVIKRVNYFKWK
jgi:hypothetical protein